MHPPLTCVFPCSLGRSSAPPKAPSSSMSGWIMKAIYPLSCRLPTARCTRSTWRAPSACPAAASLSSIAAIPTTHGITTCLRIKFISLCPPLRAGAVCPFVPSGELCASSSTVGCCPPSNAIAGTVPAPRTGIACNWKEEGLDVKKLSGREGRRLRIGGYRAIYTIDGEQLIILILDAGPRGGIYK